MTSTCSVWPFSLSESGVGVTTMTRLYADSSTKMNARISSAHAKANST
jgi:hypothetical protein